jgi:DNA-directed RNA polymerase subunit N (RpoN/RPB10)
VGDQLPTYFYDARLPFGAIKACAIFQGLSDAVVLFMERRNFHVISYIDDFLCVEDSFDRCLECMNVLSELLVSLGFVINEQKREGPAETLTFLGVSIDCVRRTLSLPESKLHDMKIL